MIGSALKNLSTLVGRERLRPIALRQITRRKEKAEEREKEKGNKVKTKRIRTKDEDLEEKEREKNRKGDQVRTEIRLKINPAGKRQIKGRGKEKSNPKARARVP